MTDNKTHINPIDGKSTHESPKPKKLRRRLQIALPPFPEPIVGREGQPPRSKPFYSDKAMKVRRQSLGVFIPSTNFPKLNLKVKDWSLEIRRRRGQV